MPLLRGKSKKAFEQNVKSEMAAGKPQDQALAIAYNMKRKPKKMARGGEMPQDPHGIDEIKEDKGFGKIIIMKAEGGPVSADGSAKAQKRPMPSTVGHDSADIRQNSSKKQLVDDHVLDRPDMKQSQKGKKISLKHPKMVPQSVYTARLRDEEDDLQESARVNEGPQIQPPKRDDEEGADRKGPDVPDMEREHNNKRKPYALGGAVEGEVHSERSIQMHEAEESDDKESAEHDSNPAIRRDADMHHEMDEQPLDEEELEHASSIAAAIMARRRKMAKGGPILSEDALESDDSSQVDLERNAEEDANMEDRASFQALRKENYSESEGLAEIDHPIDSNMHGDDAEAESENEHSKSIADRVRSRMKRSPIQR